jgi:hypothetical protein
MEDTHRLTRREFSFERCGVGVWPIRFSRRRIRRGEKGEIQRADEGGLSLGSSGLDAHRNQEFMDYQNYCLMYQA